jgi:hypothetical protein
MKLKILFHDNCFDGAASAAIFASFFRDKIRQDAEIVYQGMHHTPGDAFPPGVFSGDVNVCVDFRYSPSPRLDWWFDHHVSGFQRPEDRTHFDAVKNEQHFYDPKARSCTKYESGILAERFGFDTTRFADLIHWADIIDGAQFPDARTAVELAAPALLVMTWIENNADPELGIRLIKDLQQKSLAEIAQDDYIRLPLIPLLKRHRGAIKTIESHAAETSGVVYFDLSDTGIEAHNKFITYMLFPDCRYTVGVTRSAARVKISVGSNPWSRVPRTHNIAKICERHGGGGHPVVGAISLPPADVEKARALAREIAEELKT